MCWSFWKKKENAKLEAYRLLDYYLRQIFNFDEDEFRKIVWHFSNYGIIDKARYRYDKHTGEMLCTEATGFLWCELDRYVLLHLALAMRQYVSRTHEHRQHWQNLDELLDRNGVRETA